MYVCVNAIIVCTISIIYLKLALSSNVFVYSYVAFVNYK